MNNDNYSDNETRCSDCDRQAVHHSKMVDFASHPNGTGVDRTTELVLRRHCASRGVM